MDENNLTVAAEDRHILITKSTKKKEKKWENISLKNFKSSIVFKTSLNPTKKLNNKIKQSSSDNNPKKKVKFNDDIIIVDIDCWKEYNLGQSADENPEDFTRDINNGNNNEDTKEKKMEIKKKKKVKKNNKDDNISCTCMII